jgi:hypothetical protein
MRAVYIDFPGQGRFSRDWLERNPERAQELMAASKDAYPQCLCVAGGLPLYIAKRTHFYLARMPNSGAKHAAHCPSFEPDPTLSGRGGYSQAAIEERTDGRVLVKMDVPLVIRGTSGGVGPTALPEISSARSQRDRVGIRGLLHLLWERAGFNRWSPRMAGRRHYRQVHKYLMRAADEIVVRRAALSAHLYIPETFQTDNALDIEARRQKLFKEKMRTPAGAPQRILLLAQWRAAVETDETWALRFSHLPNEFQVRCSRETLAKVQRSSEFAFLTWPSVNPLFHLMVLLTLQRDRSGQWIADEFTHLVTTEEYVPVASIEEARLARRLIQEHRHFLKPMWYDTPPARFPSYLLTDIGDRALPAEVIYGQEADQTERRIRIVNYVDEGEPHWCWDTIEHDDIPPLPRPAIAEQPTPTPA